MATTHHSESRRKYSWWWDSHNSPKNSKWLQENLKDMDDKVKAMIKFIEEDDADTFARRAEMYYKKRPELMKLVEEFYRAYRALAERYDQSTVELRQAHRTMSEVLPFSLPDDLSSGVEVEPRTPEMQRPARAFFDPDDSEEAMSSKKGLKQLIEMLRSGMLLEKGDQGKMKKGIIVCESAWGDSYRSTQEESEAEIESLKKTLADAQAEKEAISLQYEQTLEKQSSLEKELSVAQRNAEGFRERVFEAETEVENLKAEVSKLEAEREAGLLQYKQCLEVIALLENKISLAEEHAKALSEKCENAENEVEELKGTLAEIKLENDEIAVQYELCLEIIAKMESEISSTQEEAEKLKSDLAEGDTKLRSMEEQRFLLQRSNESLRIEADNLVEEIAEKDHKLSEKHKELEKLQAVLLEEQSRFIQVETALQTLQKLHSDSRAEQKELTLELQNSLQKVKELGICNKNVQDEIISLKEMKEKLEKDFSLQTDKCSIQHQKVHRLKEEIKVLNGAYQGLVQQLYSLGFNPECLEASVNELRNENSKLKEDCCRHKGEKEALFETNVVLRSSVAELNGKLEGSRELVQELKKSCQFLQGDKSSLVAEKAMLLSQLQIMTENMQKLFEKNTMLENSFSGASSELEGLRAKSKSLEEFCKLLKDEKSNLQNERSSLISQLENVRNSLSSLENRFIKMEGKCSVMEKEKESTLSQVESLQGSLSLMQQERVRYVESSESRLSFLEDLVSLLKEETRSRKKEYEEELDKAVKAQVEIFILQKFIKDLEEKNSSLLIECQKHVDASKVSEKLIRELESEKLEQQMEAEFLLDEIDNLRGMIHQMFEALQIEPDRIPFPHVLDNVEDLKSSVDRNKDENQKLVIENSLLLTVLRQLKLESSEVELDQRAKSNILRKEKLEPFEMNQQLMLEVSKAKLQEEVLNVQVETKNREMEMMQGVIVALQEEKVKQREENGLLVQKYLGLKEEMCVLEEENSSAIEEAVAFGSLSLVLERFSVEKAKQVKALSEDFISLYLVNGELEEKIKRSEANLKKKEEENFQSKNVVEKLQMELNAEKDLNEKLHCEIAIGKDLLKKKSSDLFEAEKKFKTADDVKEELYRTFGGLKRECEDSKDIRKDLQVQILQLSRDCNEQKRKVEDLIEANEDQGAEVRSLRVQLENQRLKEESLNFELEERNNEVKLWEAEASSLYVDSQIASIREVLLEDKVRKFAEVYKTLEDESAAKSVEIRLMKEKANSVESVVEGLKNNGHCSSGLLVEKELGVDKIEVSMSNRWLRQGGAISKRFLEKLSSNTLKLTSLQTAVRELKKRVEMTRRRDKVYADEYEEVVGQLEEVEEAIIEQVNIHDQLEAGKGQKEEAQKGSEKIDKLQFELQTIEYVLLKLEDEKKSVRNKVSTGHGRVVLLRDYIYGGRRRRIRSCFGSCVRQSTVESLEAERFEVL